MGAALPSAVAERFDRPRVGLALGAGAARGLAHLGVLAELEALGIRPDVLAGASIGATVAVSYAAGRLDQLEHAARGVTWLQIARLVDLGVHGGLIDGARLHEFLEDVLGEAALETLDPPVTVVAADMVTGREVWLTEGPVIDAVSASSAIPGLFPPVNLHRRWLVDGAVVNPLPVAPVRARNVGIILAVNRSGPIRLEPLRTLRDPSEAPATPPGFVDVVAPSITVMQDTIALIRRAGDPCDVPLAPEVRRFGLFELNRADALIEAGRAAVRREADRLRELCRPG